MGALRVISGSAKGLRLKSVPGDTTRPITDKVKEALFNILGDEIQDARILDLFGGTGAVGIEALSRGALFATFLDKSAQAVKTIQQNLETTHLSPSAKVIRTDAFIFLSYPQSQDYDLIYVAPPQYKEMWQKAMDLLDQHPGLLSEKGQIIVQINPIEWVDRPYTHFTMFDLRKYGDTLLVFFEKINLKIA
ncbi:MAG: 16S rRNA (guanine(966)-N(2))-methyltransferase RsmD [Anaerolineaceae bacterium]